MNQQVVSKQTRITAMLTLLHTLRSELEIETSNTWSTSAGYDLSQVTNSSERLDKELVR